MKAFLRKFSFLCFTVMVLVALSFVPDMAEKEMLTASGYVKAIYPSGKQDIVVRLCGDKKQYLIEDGLQKGLDPEELRCEMLGKRVRLKYPRSWGPLDPYGESRSVSVMESCGGVLYQKKA